MPVSGWKASVSRVRVPRHLRDHAGATQCVRTSATRSSESGAGSGESATGLRVATPPPPDSRNVYRERKGARVPGAVAGHRSALPRSARPGVLG